MARDSLNACNVIGLYQRSFSQANHLTALLEPYFKVMFRADYSCLPDLGGHSEKVGERGQFFRYFEENSWHYSTKNSGKMDRSPAFAVDST